VSRKGTVKLVISVRDPRDAASLLDRAAELVERTNKECDVRLTVRGSGKAGSSNDPLPQMLALEPIETAIREEVGKELDRQNELHRLAEAVRLHEVKLQQKDLPSENVAVARKNVVERIETVIIGGGRIAAAVKAIKDIIDLVP
jgi:hypothetical protein